MRYTIERLVARARETGSLARAFTVGVDPARFAAAARFTADRYIRVPLYRDEGLEVRLLCWLPGQSSALHDHGGSACAFQVLSGEATEILLDGTVRRLRPGDVSEVRDDVVHQVGNDGDAPLLTLHLYAPPLPIDPPTAIGAARRDIVIVGSGFSGAALAYHLLRRDDPSIHIMLVESGRDIARGIAYVTRDVSHILNVPAAGMSIDPADPEDFLRFARVRGVEAGPLDLLPRCLYGDYVVQRLADAIGASRATLRLVRCEAIDLARNASGLSVALADGRTLPADQVVLATGHGPHRVPDGLRALRGDPRLVEDPWAPGALEAVPAEARVLVVGTGLTAIDVLLTLRNRGQPPVTALSRSGRWPGRHLDPIRWPESWTVNPDLLPQSADGLASWLAEEFATAASRGFPWQAVIDGLRPHAATIWSRMSEAERRHFLGHHRSTWERLRHRAPAQTRDALRGWREEGWLTTLAGEVAAVRADRVVLADGREVAAEHIILCTGAESDVTRVKRPLWRNLLGSGLSIPDPLGLGVPTDADGQVFGAHGPVPGLWAIGGLRRPALFESTAVPELAAQARALAGTLAAASRAGG